MREAGMIGGKGEEDGEEYIRKECEKLERMSQRSINGKKKSNKGRRRG